MSVALAVAVRRALAALAIALCALLVLTGAAAATVTQAHTENAGTTQTAANLHALVSSDTPSVTYHFDYGTTTAYGASTTAQNAAGSVGQVSYPIANLSPNTTYYFRVVATDSAGTITDTPTAPNGTFTTQAPPPPPPTYHPLVSPVNVSGGTDQDPTAFTLHGEVDYSGPPEGVSYHFEYGLTMAYGHSTPTASATTPAMVSAQLTYLNDLPQSGTYHVRLVANDASNVTYAGDDSTFVVQPRCPSSEFSVLGVTRVGRKVSVALQVAAMGEVDSEDVPGFKLGNTFGGYSKLTVGSGRFNPVSHAGTFSISGNLSEEQYFNGGESHSPSKVIIPLGFQGLLHPEDPPYEFSQECVQDGTLHEGGAPVYHVVRAIFQPGGANGQGPSIPAGVAKALVPSGRAASVAAILKAGAYPAAVTPPGAGTVQISWYYVVAGAHVARAGGAKPILIASGSERVVKAGKTTLKIKLTANGRAMLKKVLKGHKLKLTAKGSFAPKTGRKITKTKAFSLKR